MGFSVPLRLLSERWALTPPFHPYLNRRCRLPRRFQFLWHFPSGRLAASPPACIPSSRQGYAASRPMEFGLSSPGCSFVTPGAILRPSQTRSQPIPPSTLWQAPTAVLPRRQIGDFCAVVLGPLPPRRSRQKERAGSLRLSGDEVTYVFTQRSEG